MSSDLKHVVHVLYTYVVKPRVQFFEFRFLPVSSDQLQLCLPPVGPRSVCIVCVVLCSSLGRLLISPRVSQVPRFQFLDCFSTCPVSLCLAVPGLGCQFIAVLFTVFCAAPNKGGPSDKFPPISLGGLCFLNRCCIVSYVLFAQSLNVWYFPTMCPSFIIYTSNPQFLLILPVYFHVQIVLESPALAVRCFLFYFERPSSHMCYVQVSFPHLVVCICFSCVPTCVHFPSSPMVSVSLCPLSEHLFLMKSFQLNLHLPPCPHLGPHTHSHVPKEKTPQLSDLEGKASCLSLRTDPCLVFNHSFEGWLWYVALFYFT